MRRPISLLLAAALTLPLPASALAAEAPPEPLGEAAVYTAPAFDSGETEAIDAPAAASITMPEGGVTMTVTGAMEGLEEVSYYGIDGTFPAARAGIDQFPEIFTGLLPGGSIGFWLRPEYRLTAESATVVYDDYFYDFLTAAVTDRQVCLLAPSGGTINVRIERSGEQLPRKIPLTEYGRELGAWLSANMESGQMGFDADENGDSHYWITSGAVMIMEIRNGYTVQVLKGGRVKNIGGYYYPTTDPDTIGVTVEVDLDADEFVYAVVKQGETFQAPEQSAQQAPPGEASGVTVNITGAAEGFQKLCYYGPGGSLEPVEGNTVPAGVTALVYLAPGYALTAENGTVTDDLYDMGAKLSTPAAPNYTMNAEGLNIYSRVFHVTAPGSGTMTVNIAPSDDPLPQLIPVTFYNEQLCQGIDFDGVCWHNTLPDGTGQYVMAGGASMKISVKQGYNVQVLRGGRVTQTGLPENPQWHPGCVAVTVQADRDADEFVIAIVKQGESFQTPGGATGTFRDVADGSWYRDVVEQAYAAGIIAGTSADTFCPNGAATRGQTVAMLYRMAGSPAVSGGTDFTDLTADYYKDAVAWASDRGVTEGVSQTAFAPDEAATREQLAVMLYRVVGQPSPFAGGLLERFSDCGAIHDYAHNAMLWAVDNHILTGYEDGTVRPGAVATRAEICAMLMRFNEVYGMYMG